MRRNLVSLIALSFAIFNANSTTPEERPSPWKYEYTNQDNGKQYVYKERQIDKEDGRPIGISLVNFAFPLDVGIEKPIKSSLFVFKVDCASKLFMPLVSQWKSERWGLGDTLRELPSDNAEWKKIPPRHAAHFVIKSHCSKN